MRIPFGRLLSMFAAGDPRAELYFMYSVISLAALGVVTGLIIIIHIRRRRNLTKWPGRSWRTAGMHSPVQTIRKDK